MKLALDSNRSEEQLSRGAPVVSVAIPALNEAGKIGRVLDKMPEDPRFVAFVVDDGSTDGTGDEAHEHGAALVIRHERPGGVGAAIRDAWLTALERKSEYVGLISGDDQHDPADLVSAFEALLAANADYVQGSRWIDGGKVEGPAGRRAIGTRLYSVLFSALALRRSTDATNGFRIFRTSMLDDPRIDIRQSWLDRYDLEPYVLFKALTLGYRTIEHPVTVRYHTKEGYSKMRGIRDWWRLARPALLLRLRIRK
jgi:dolichol-phosphate mannosyltransferase